MTTALAEKQRHYTYSTFPWEKLSNGKLAELIEGEIMFFNAPGRRHQQISMKLSIQIGNFLQGKEGEVYAAPFDVSLFPKDDMSEDTVVMPDLFVVLDMEKLKDERYCKGTPDWIIEITSPSTRSHDNVFKFNQYLKAGVREYWIVCPEDKTVQVHILDNNRYVTSAYAADATIPVSVLPGCAISLPAVFSS
ncbi:MAG: Uma2 family endonuclease [Treponema sp.]|nr:Uma2 family endonuclease [Treponema sp.]